jgi:Family of unknown function (DUF6364)
MNAKLTLSLNQEIIIQAKDYAHKTGRSLSQMVESYFENLTKNSEIADDINPKVKKLIGIVKLPDDFDQEKVKEEYYREKFGL